MLVEIQASYGTGIYDVSRVRRNWRTLVLEGHRHYDRYGKLVNDDNDEEIDVGDIVSVTIYGGHECSDGTMHIVDPDLLQHFINYVNMDVVPLFISYELAGEEKLRQRKEPES